MNHGLSLNVHGLMKGRAMGIWATTWRVNHGFWQAVKEEVESRLWSNCETKPCKDLAEMWAGHGFRSRLVPSRDMNDEFTAKEDCTALGNGLLKP